MDEQNGPFIFEAFLADTVDKPGHRFTGVDRVEQNAFQTREQFHRFHAVVVRNTVSRGKIVVPQRDSSCSRQFKTARNLLLERDHFRQLIGHLAGNGDANQLGFRHHLLEPHGQTGMGSRAAGGHHHGGNRHRTFALLSDFQRALHVPQRAQRV